MASPDARRKTSSASPATTVNMAAARPLRHLPAAALIVYPATLFLGSLFSVISPTARATRTTTKRPNSSLLHTPDPQPLAPGIAAHQNFPSSPANYFARKDNIFNTYFVKIGWAWTTIAFVALLLSQPAYTAAVPQRGRRVAQAFVRYAILTTIWYLTTQWCFGPPIIDRSFVLTGGKCREVEQTLVSAAEPVRGLQTMVTAAACKAAGGSWTGGTDVSGHVFLLVLASALLVLETWGASSATGTMEEERSAISDGSGENKRNGENDGLHNMGPDYQHSSLRIWSLRFVWVVVGLMLWMLLMTAVWFHTWLEKWSGLAVASSAIYVVYFLPRTLPSWRNIVGIPGV